MPSYDYKKEFKELYLPKTSPSVINVPAMKFIQVRGKGNPNDTGGEYQSALDALYSLSNTIKFMPKGGITPKDYFAYVVPPLEGMWWMEGIDGIDYSRKRDFNWISMIRQPEFVTDEVFSQACEIVAKKMPQIDLSKAHLVVFEEGFCVQCMHIGAYDDEPATVSLMDRFIAENNLESDFTETRLHHEIYLSDPRKTELSKSRTIIRHPVKTK